MSQPETRTAHAAQRYFNRWAKRYDRSPAQRWFRENHRLVMETVDPPSDARIVDLGCGTGQLATSLAEHVPRGGVLGLDPAEQMIRVASKRKAPNLRFVVGSSDAIPADARSFDVAVSTISFHHWTQPGKSLEEIARVLAPGGRLFILDFCRDNPLMVVFDSLARRFQPSHYRIASSEEMRRHLSAAGFRRVVVTRSRWVLMLAQATAAA
jgi:ubiquinone/menaquinone biosynthesis C-methylase UbiE